MGMYTELVISTRIKNDPTVVEILKFLTGDKTIIPELPRHDFFKCSRWRWICSSSSYYFVPRSISLFEFDNIGDYWVLISRADFKNYEDEIGKFDDWVQPYLDGIEGEMWAYSRYEENDSPTIHYIKEKT